MTGFCGYKNTAYVPVPTPDDVSGAGITPVDSSEDERQYTYIPSLSGKM